MSISAAEETGHLSREKEEDEETTNNINTTPASSYHEKIYQYTYPNTSSSEIEEEGSSGTPMETIKEEQFEGISMFSFDVHSRGEDCVYVAVGKSESSMDAVAWTLRNLINDDSTIVYLIHVFPEIHYIPSPLGKLPKNQVSPEQVEIYMAQERAETRRLLQSYINLCSASKVKVDTMLVESDNVSKAVIDLVPILNVKKLVLGTTKSGLRKLKARKGSGIANQILESAWEYGCDVKIICDGSEVMDQMMRPPSPSPSPGEDGNAKFTQSQHQPNSNYDTFSCMCFKPPRVM